MVNEQIYINIFDIFICIKYYLYNYNMFYKIKCETFKNIIN